MNTITVPAGAGVQQTPYNNGQNRVLRPMSGRLSQRVQAVPPSGIRKYFDIAATMDDVISLGIGEPDFVSPPPILQAGIASLQRGHTAYTSNSGIYELREAVVRNLSDLYGARDYDPDTEALITVGVSEAMYIAMQAILDPGDEVIVPQPCFVSYTASVILAGGTVVDVPTYASDNFFVNPAAIRGRHHPAHQGAAHRLSEQPNRCGHGLCGHAGDRAHRRGARPDCDLRRDLRPACLRGA